MGYRYLRDNGVLDPPDLALVQKVFRKLSAERGFTAESIESEELAIRALALFRSGISEEISLAEALRGRSPA